MDNRLMQMAAAQGPGGYDPNNVATLPEWLLQTLKMGAQGLPGVAQDISEMTGVQPRHDPSQFEDPMSYGHMASRVENGDANARLGRTISTLGGANVAARIPTSLAALGGMGAGQATAETMGAGLGLGSVAVGAGNFQGRSDLLRNLLMQRMQRGQSLPPGLLDQ